MKTADFDFDLPEDRIALRPANPRDSAKLLQVGAVLRDHIVRDLPTLLRAGDVLVFNNTRVIPARLSGVRPGDGRRGEAGIEVTLHLRKSPEDWLCFCKPAKRLREKDQVIFESGLTAIVASKGEGGEVLLRFSESGPALDEAIARAGVMPLPPYIAGKRAVDAQDAEDYQTIYAERDGAVAAPTAGLHFTPELFAALEEASISRETVTLHVGAGTFLPVKAEKIADHKMHAEWGEVPEDVAERLNTARADGCRIIAVGTTSLRLLESAANAAREIQPFMAETDIFITPGYRFNGIDGLMTNFHLPKSTLFMLVSALAGMNRMKAAYAHAIAQGYRFYSYGDSSLIWPSVD